MSRRNTSRFLMVVVAVGVMLLASACGMGVKLPDPSSQDPSPGDDENVFYFEDFSQYQPGDQPEGWNINSGDDGELGVVEIVEDPELESQRALKMSSKLVEGKSQNFTAGAPRWSMVSPEVATIGYEYKVRVVDSSGINAYITKSGTHRVVTGVGAGKLTYTEGSGFQTLADLPDGWNTVRIIANRVNKTADIYLNGELVGDKTGLRNDVDSWTDAYAYFLISTSSAETKEVYFGDLKAWIAE